MKCIRKGDAPVKFIRVTCKNLDCKAELEIEKKDLEYTFVLDPDHSMIIFHYQCSECQHLNQLSKEDIPRSWSDAILNFH